MACWWFVVPPKAISEALPQAINMIMSGEIYEYCARRNSSWSVAEGRRDEVVARGRGHTRKASAAASWRPNAHR